MPEFRLNNINDVDTLLLIPAKLQQNTNGDKVKMLQVIKKIIQFLTVIPTPVYDDVNFLALEEWSYALMEKYWRHRISLVLSANQTTEEENFVSKAVYCILSIENACGTLYAETLVNVISNRNGPVISNNDIIQILSDIHFGHFIPLKKLNKMSDGASIFNFLNKDIPKNQAGERNVKQLEQIIKGNGNISENILASIDKAIKIMGLSNPNFSESASDSFLEEWSNPKTKPRTLTDFHYSKILSIIDSVILQKRGFRLRDTQKLIILTSLFSTSSILTQVSTGEGKSLIVVCIAIMKCILLRQKVDVVTSSSVLAKRDALQNADIFSRFKLKPGHNCYEEIAERQRVYSSCDVVYGDLSSFQRDFLLDRFYSKNILGDRSFQAVIVDEVDSMLLDKGNNILYLSHDLGDMDKLQAIFIFIWQLINKPDVHFLEKIDVETIYSAVMQQIYNLIDSGDLKTLLDTKLTDDEADQILVKLEQLGIIDCDGVILTTPLSFSQTLSHLKKDDLLFKYSEPLQFILREKCEGGKILQVPVKLKPFVKRHLKEWITNGILALHMKERVDYVVDVDHFSNSTNNHPNITILDRDTGTDLTNSLWDGALHQFLQLKHSCYLSLLSLKAVFISNVTFLKKYSNLIGLTGTLGSAIERDLLQSIHSVDFVTIPTSRVKRFQEEVPIVCETRVEWAQAVYDIGNKYTTKLNRSVLIICETVEDVHTLRKRWGSHDNNVHTYTRDYEEFDVVKGKNETVNQDLGPGVIIIATNLAGRGTDIKINKTLQKAGGLHVILVYLPSNNRIEEQAFGRAARCGEPGSGQLIAINPYSGQAIFACKTERDLEEVGRISDIKTFYETQITLEEEFFNRFQSTYLQLETRVKQLVQQEELQILLLRACLDRWAYWLDENSPKIARSTEGTIKNVTASFETFIQSLGALKCLEPTDWIKWIDDDSVSLNYFVKLGRILALNGKTSQAATCFQQVITKDPNFSELAHYFNVLTFDISKSTAFARVEGELRKACVLFQQRIQSCYYASGAISKIKHQSSHITQIDAFEKQQKSMIDLYNLFIKSVNDIMGHTVSPECFINYTIDEILARRVFQDLQEHPRLTGIIEQSLAKSVSYELVNKLSHDHGILSRPAFQKLLGSNNWKQQRCLSGFEKLLKQNVSLPSRNGFWKCLKTKTILHSEMKYVFIDKQKLSKVDPGLLAQLNGSHSHIKCNRLKFENFTGTQNFIAFNVDQLQQLDQSMYHCVLKDNLKKLLGSKYTVLKEAGVFIYNKTASLNLKNVQKIKFPCEYDHMVFEDVINQGVSATTAKGMFDDLVENGFLVRRKDFGFKLGSNFTNLEDLELDKFSPIYESLIKTTISIRFPYQLALQKIAEQIQQNSFPVKIPILINPYQSLLSSLIDEGIITQDRIKPHDSDSVRENLESLYSRFVKKSEILTIFKKSGVFSPQELSNTFNDLLSKNWIKPSTDLYGHNISDRYEIQDSVSHDWERSCDSRQIYLHYHRLLADKLFISHLVDTLARLRSSLLSADTPDFNLEPLRTLLGQHQYSLNDELALFFSNGADSVITVKEKAYTWTMIWNTIAVIVIGMVQIVVGTLIELFSVGFFTHVGGAFVSEGISDIFFAMNSLRTGHFSWKEYGSHKIESILFTMATAGIGAMFSRGAKFSRFGSKIGGPGIEIGGKKMSQMAGKKLIKACNQSVFKEMQISVGKEFAKKIAQKTLQGLAMGAVNSVVDAILENVLRNLCGEIGDTFLSEIENCVNNNPELSQTLTEIWTKLGPDTGYQMVMEVTQSALAQNTLVHQLTSVGSRIAGVFLQGLGQASEKIGKSSGNPAFTCLAVIRPLFVWGERAANVANISLITNNFLSNLNAELKAKLRDCPSQGGPCSRPNDHAIQNFKAKVLQACKTQLKEKAGGVVSSSIVGPLLKEGGHKLVSHVGKRIKKAYRNCKEDGYYNRFIALKKQNELETAGEEVNGGIDQDMPASQLDFEYHKKLLMLIQKTRNPELFSSIVLENIPMTMVCAQTTVFVVNRYLASKGIKGMTLVINGQGGLKQTFSTEEGSVVVQIHLNDGHFYITNNLSIHGETQGTDNKNNCLFESLLVQLPELGEHYTPQSFREEIANYIKSDHEIGHLIRSGYHSFSIAIGGFGGAKKNNKHTQNKGSLKPENKVRSTSMKTQDPYQHAKYTFCPEKDRDLRDEKLCTQQKVNDQRVRGMQTALAIINETLSTITQNRVDLSPMDFTVTQYDLVMLNKQKFSLSLCPVDMKANLELKVKKSTVKATVEINIDNPGKTSNAAGPRGPHIGYKISIPNLNPLQDFKKPGHILLNQKGNESLPERMNSNKIKIDALKNKKFTEISISDLFQGKFDYVRKYPD